MKKLVIATTVLTLALALPALAQETLDTRIGKLSFTKKFATGYPARELCVSKMLE